MRLFLRSLVKLIQSPVLLLLGEHADIVAYAFLAGVNTQTCHPVAVGGRRLETVDVGVTRGAREPGHGGVLEAKGVVS